MSLLAAVAPAPLLLVDRPALSARGAVQYVGVTSHDARSSVSLGGPSFRFVSVTSSGVTNNDDDAIVSAMARGDERAAATLYDRYSAALFGLAIRIVGEQSDAEDVVLDAFTQAWNTASRYDGGRGTVLGWLTTIVRSRALDVVRGRGRRDRAVDTATRAMGDEPVAVAGAAIGAAERVELDERALAVGSAMHVLSDQQRQAIELAFFDGLSHSEIAERLGEPLGTIKTRIRLGMQRLRDVLRTMPQAMTS